MTCWAVGFFIFHASAPIHTLAGLAILMILHLMIKGELLCPPDPSGKEIPCKETM